MIALDLFAGTGWGVACQWLGVEEYGVELMPEVVATRTANGMVTLYTDVWTGLEEPLTVFDSYDLLIASPPCQTFSMAGSGSGRKALDEVVGLIDSKAYRDVTQLRAFGERHDPRTSLVLTPLTHVYRDLPRYVVLEQVPPVLPVWERMATEMRAWGYSVWTGVLNAEQYGVPQTRRRAVLIAKRDPDLDGEALPPVPTHSRYYPRDKTKLDPGVAKWVSMAEALSWTEPREVISTTSTGGDYGKRGKRGGDLPAQTILANYDRTVVEFIANDRRARSAKRLEHEPAPTITGGHDSGNRMWAVKSMGAGMVERHGERPGRPEEVPAFTVRANAGGTEPGGFKWAHERPATTVAGDPRIWPPGHKVNAADIARHDNARERYGDRAGTESVKVTIDEAATLQSYPEGFTFSGNKGKQFLQVGNAVPPLLARAILSAVLA